ncbi:type I polyketide synthase [Amycolatopsis sp. NPDC088138]|uniref:type I polyketide synthase n=1 Tax=Amycolatopsis sp. NPDC088138 TaxID=3363938 RepID=UPI0037F8E439
MTVPMEDAVAIIGMACRLPGAPDVPGFWTALRSGAEGITHHRLDDLLAHGVDPDLVRDPHFVPARGVLAGAYDFDWTFFGYSRAEAAGIDPQQRVFLECASAAIDDAGIDPARFPGWIGVYAGADWVSGRAGEAESLSQVIGQDKDFLTTRVAYKLGFRGPAITVQTACSTGLTAVHMATQSLLGYECDAALAGGVAVGPRTERGYLYREGGILSPDGHCRPFDEHAAGTVPSEGVGIVVLKRAEDALRDGDRIAAIILGSAVNNDGGDKIGYTAPAIPGQRDVIRLAQKVAGVDPADVDHVETHGTATRMGDPVEVQALTDVFGPASDSTGWCRLGAVKSNIGHTGAASGVAGLIKTVLMLQHGELVPTLHYSRPNPMLQLESTPFRVCTERQPWPDRGTPLAAVSAFGVGGTNAHVIVQGPPRRTRPASATTATVLAVSSASAEGLVQMRRNLADHLRSRAGVVLPEASRTLAGRRRFNHRQAIVAANVDEAATALRSATAAASPEPVGRVAFLFPGQGTLRGPAGAAVHRLFTGFAEPFDEVADAVRELGGPDLAPVVSETGESPEWFADTVHQQLGLFALGYALGRQLGAWGIEPAAMLGNSIGEYAAAALAGLWSPADAVALVYERARAMRDTEPGLMAAVDAGAGEVRRRLGPESAVTIAVAGPGRVVLSGGEPAMTGLLAGRALTGLEVRLLETRRAFHSPSMDSAAAIVRNAARSVPHERPASRMVSGVSGTWVDPDHLGEADYWADQVRRPVLLDEAMSALLTAECDTYVELGPGSSMLGGFRRHRGWTVGRAALPMLGRSADDAERTLLRVLGFLWERGIEAPLEHLLEASRPIRCALPPHPFAGRDPDPASQPARTTTEPRPSAATQDPVLEQLWCAALGVPSVAAQDDFFALGGESLMVVSLIHQVRERTGVTVPVTVFTATPTFGRLVELASRDAPDPPGLVELQAGGHGRPLFFVADAMDTATSYRELASLLGDRPGYGLEPVARAHRIEDIARQHVETVVRAQPSGPYTLCGWSFGAVVAHEVAYQLTRRGDRVDALICLDGFVSPRGLLPDFPLLVEGIRLQLHAARGTGAVGELLARAPGLRWVFTANIRAALRYRPRPVPCPAVLFEAGARRRTARRLTRLSTLYGGGVQLGIVGGGHWSMLQEPHVQDLAARLREALPVREGVPTGG